MWSNPQYSAGLVTFTEEILHGKLNFLCSAIFYVTRLDHCFYNIHDKSTNFYNIVSWESSKSLRHTKNRDIFSPVTWTLASFLNFLSLVTRSMFLRFLIFSLVWLNTPLLINLKKPFSKSFEAILRIKGKIYF